MWFDLRRSRGSTVMKNDTPMLNGDQGRMKGASCVM